MSRRPVRGGLSRRKHEGRRRHLGWRCGPTSSTSSARAWASPPRRSASPRRRHRDPARPRRRSRLHQRVHQSRRVVRGLPVLPRCPQRCHRPMHIEIACDTGRPEVHLRPRRHDTTVHARDRRPRQASLPKPNARRRQPDPRYRVPRHLAYLDLPGPPARRASALRPSNRRVPAARAATRATSLRSTWLGTTVMQ